MEVIMIFIFLFVLPTVVSQKLVYNTTYCKQHGSIFNASSILPRFPSYAMSISSSTYQAGKPITIEVKACKQNGFRAFLLKATIQGYVYTGVNPKSIKLGTIMVSCGVRKGSLVSIKIPVMYFRLHCFLRSIYPNMKQHRACILAISYHLA